jgi:hypothetical protein
MFLKKENMMKLKEFIDLIRDTNLRVNDITCSKFIDKDNFSHFNSLELIIITDKTEKVIFKKGFMTFAEDYDNFIKFINTYKDYTLVNIIQMQFREINYSGNKWDSPIDRSLTLMIKP